MVEPGHDPEDRPAEEHVVEVRDDEVRVGLLQVGRGRRVHDARDAADREQRDERHAGEDADNESGVIAERRRWRGVILSPAGPVHNTKLMVLLLLTFGQFLIVALTAFVLWLAGQYGDPPNWRWLRSLRKLRSFGR